MLTDSADGLKLSLLVVSHPTLGHCTLAFLNSVARYDALSTITSDFRMTIYFKLIQKRMTKLSLSKTIIAAQLKYTTKFSKQFYAFDDSLPSVGDVRITKHRSTPETNNLKQT